MFGVVLYVLVMFYMHLYAYMHTSTYTCTHIAIPSNIKDNKCLCVRVSTSLRYCMLRSPLSLLSSIMCRLYTCSRFCGMRMNILLMKRSSVLAHFWAKSHHQFPSPIEGQINGYLWKAGVMSTMTRRRVSLEEGQSSYDSSFPLFLVKGVSFLSWGC